LGSTEVRLSGNELSAQTKYVLQKKKIQWMAVPIEILLKGKMVSSGHILVGILGIQQGNGRRRKTIHHDMEFQLAQL
jgi:hypothetical protein